MGERSTYWRSALAIVVIVAAVVGFAFASAPGAALSAAAADAHGGTTAAASAVTTDLSSGPLVSLQGSGTSISPTAPTVFGTTTVEPDPAAFDASTPFSVEVTLTPTGSLSNLISEQSDVASSHYRQYLSAASLGSTYGNPDYASLEAYFEGYGLSVTPSATDLALSVTGTVAEISQAFHTSLSAFSQTYASQGVWNPLFGNASATAGTTSTGPVFYSNTAPAELPSGLANIVNGIAGLDGMTATPNIQLPTGISPASSFLVNSSVTVGPTWSSWQDELAEGSDGSGNYAWASSDEVCYEAGICGYGDYQFLFPSSLPSLTGANNLFTGATTIDSEPDTGQGITIVVIEVGCAIPSDLSEYSQFTFGSASQLNDRLTQFALDVPGLELFPNTNLDDCLEQGYYAGWTIESDLDVEYAAAEAPGAHIDLVGIPYPGNFSAFDLAYSDIAQYLALGSTGGVCASTSTLEAAGLYPVEGSASDGACSATITSNSYGSGEEYTYFYGSPMYITAEDQLLELLNAVGVTNFFANGDGGGTYETVNDFMPADSPGATGVGGGQLTALGTGGVPFPYGKWGCLGEQEWYYCYGIPVQFVPVTGVSSFSYWSYSEGLGGTYTGAVGGGFGQSLAESQPWWENAYDTYSTGSEIDPIVSNTAAFNMTIWAYGGWYIFYGGTSFACPITAGEWALVEEQADVAFGSPEIGDANPLLFGAHNAFEAGALSGNPYTPMINDGWGFDTAPTNSYTWYYYNLSIEVPSAPVQPFWFPTIYNPAGDGWNYLQGLGFPSADVLAEDLFGQTGVAGHSLADPAFSLVLVEGGGSFAPVPTTLTAGTTYTFEVVSSSGSGGTFGVTAYSGQSNAGAYAGGTWTSITTASTGIFSYTPTTGTPPGGDGATTYGYFLVKSLTGGSSAEWSFVFFAVAAPTPEGSLTLCVVDAYGNCDQGDAEVTTFTTTTVGDYNLFGQSEVYLNGLPVAAAVVTQVSVQTQYGIEDESLPPADYAPGVTLGTTISDSRGEAVFWIDGFTAEYNGPLYTDIYQLTATYDGLVSNTVTVYAEPQAGSFYTANLGVTDDGAVLSGDLTFAGMKYVDSINVSVGGAPGQYDNWTCPLPAGAPQPANTLLLPGCDPYYDTNFGADIWESGVSAGSLPVDISLAGLEGAAVVSIIGIGANDLTYGYSFYGYTYYDQSVQNPLVWQDPLVFFTPSVSLGSTGTVTGVDTVSWTGTAYGTLAGATAATGTLSLVWGGGSEVLATYALAQGDATSGTFALDTTTLADGYYAVVFTETAAGGLSSVREASFYAGNEIAKLTAEVATLTAAVAQDASLISWLQTNLGAANASLSALSGQLATAQATIAGLQAQIATLSATNSADSATLATLNAQLTSDEAQIATLQSQVSQLQSELNQKKTVGATAWYDALGTFGIGALVAIAALVAGIGAYLAGRRSSRKLDAPVASEQEELPAPSETSASELGPGNGRSLGETRRSAPTVVASPPTGLASAPTQEPSLSKSMYR